MITDPLRILIVDDSALYRLFVRNVVEKIPGCDVVGSAKNGTEALQKIAELEPDLVTLDVEMPDFSGIEVLRRLKATGDRTPILMLSKFTEAGAQVTTDALMEGAFDAICKSSLGDCVANQRQLTQELESKIEALRLSQQQPELDLGTTKQGVVDDEVWSCSAVVIGCSTGGPEALRLLMKDIPGSFPVPIVIVQHIPKYFSHSLAKRLDGLCDLSVQEAQRDMPMEIGGCYVAPGGLHLGLRYSGSQFRFETSEDPPENNCRPAVDFTLRSMTDALEGQLLSVILTGMGRDGLLGCKSVKAGGGRVIAQHSDGCTVFGMPREVIKANLADQVVRLPALAKAIQKQLEISG